MAASSEARELELVEKVSMRIALAKDDRLGTLLQSYLCPLLLKLASPHVNVRNKVVDLCQHIKIRLAGNQDIVLPVAALLKQYKATPDSTMVRHFDLLFVQQSIGKLTWPQQADLLPILTQGLSEDAGKPTSGTVFNLFLRLLPRLKLPPRGSEEDKNLRAELGFEENPKDAEFVALWLAKLMLFTAARPSLPGGTQPVPPGLSAEDVNFLATGNPDTWNPQSPQGLSLIETKIVCLKFLASGAFTDPERYLAGIIASADTNSRIYELGEDLSKRTSVSIEDATVVEKLYEIYDDSLPALKIRILNMLGKSKVAATYPEQIKKVMTNTLYLKGDYIGAPKGLEALKLHRAFFSFVIWVSRVAPRESLASVAPFTMKFVGECFDEMGWPIPMHMGEENTAVRGLAYDALGTMAAAVPSTFLEKDLGLIRWLFRAAAEDRSPDTILVSIEGALSSLLNAFPVDVDPEVRSALRLMLLEFMAQQRDEDAIRSVRFITVRWANKCLEYKDIVGRWIDVVALAPMDDEKRDIAEEGRRGLNPFWYRILNLPDRTAEVHLPIWKDLIRIFFTPDTVVHESYSANTIRSGVDLNTPSVFGNFGGYKLKAFEHAVSYCRQMVLLEALQTPLTIGDTADWERQIDVLMRSDMASRRRVRAFLAQVPTETLSIYFLAAFEGMIWNNGQGLGDCARSFVELASLAPAESLTELATRASELLPSVMSNDIATRISASQALGILCSHPANDVANAEQVISQLSSTMSGWKSAIGAELNKVQGALVALGFALSRSVFYGRRDSVSSQLYDDAVSKVLELVCESTHKGTREAGFICFGTIATVDLVSDERWSAKLSAVKAILTDEAKKGSEKAIPALGRLALAYREGSAELQSVLDTIYDLHELRQSEVHFAVGEALAVATSGWDSDSLLLTMDVPTSYKGDVERSSTLKTVIQKVLQDCKKPKPSLKKASGIWLFSLIQYCGHLPEIQERLRECQAAFMGLLSARDDLVQETASRGLSLVYEQGDKDLKERLVADLVASFTGTTTKIKVDEDTELFEPGALPTGDGESVTSYKDIMSLAAEVGDQSLVYKFMSLASNAATWSTRAAFGRFGLSNILSDSAVDPKLYPKLYRYRFDPNPNVQRSMNEIWNALVKSTSKTVRENFDPIMTDLLKNILGKEWRTREASCLAIADLVQSSRFEDYEKYLSQIWDVAFKVLDDIKGSVRKAAETLCKVLTNILVRQLEAGGESKNSQAMLKEVMPFLFSTRGLESPSKEVQAFAYDTVLKLVKNGGKTLLPFIPTLVEQILGLLSTLEPDFVNYLHMNAEKYDTTQEKIDAARSTAVSHSPLMESVESCLDLLDDDTMKALVPRLQSVIKTAVGMPSKIGCSGVLVSLATRHSFVFRPHAGVFLKLIEKAVLDRNATVSAAYARAAGYIARQATDQQIIRLAAFSKELYFVAEDETRRQIAADILYAVSKFATDRFNAVSSELLPFVFFARHDFDEHVRDLFTKTWEDNVGGSRAVLLYLKEIISISEEHLGSAKWTVKHSAALTIADVVTSAGTSMGVADARVVWPALEKALALKTFDGKEKVLDAFVSCTECAKAFWSEDAAVKATMTKIAIREAKRNNAVYRPHAFRALGGYAMARPDVDMFADVAAVVTAYCSSITDEDAMDIDDDDKKAGSRTTVTLNASASALLKAAAAKSELTILNKVNTALEAVFETKKWDINTCVVVYEGTKTLFASKAAGPVDDAFKKEQTEWIGRYIEFIDIRSDEGSELARTKRAEATLAIVDRAVEDGLYKIEPTLFAKLKGYVEEAVAGERAAGVKRLYESALGRIEALNVAT